MPVILDDGTIGYFAWESAIPEDHIYLGISRTPPPKEPQQDDKTPLSSEES